MTDSPTQNDYGVETEHRTVIDGQAYSTHLYGAGEGFSHLPMLLEIASSPAGLAMDAILAVVKELKDGNVPIALTGEQVRLACVHLAQAIVNAGGTPTAKALLSNTTTRSRKGVVKVEQDFDACFQGRYGHLFKVLGWVLEVNYAPFLRGALPAIWSRLASVRSDLQGALNPSPSASTSQDGDSPSTASPTPTA